MFIKMVHQYVKSLSEISQNRVCTVLLKSTIIMYISSMLLFLYYTSAFLLKSTCDAWNCLIGPEKHYIQKMRLKYIISEKEVQAFSATFQWVDMDFLMTYIGIQHDFLCINICRTPRGMLKPEDERQGFQPLPRSSVNDLYQKSICDRYYCIGYVLTSNNVENVSKSSFFLVSRIAPLLALLC